MVLKRCVLIFSDLIFESRVERGMPSLALHPKVRTHERLGDCQFSLLFKSGSREEHDYSE